MMWKKLGKQGLAVKAAWPVAEEEDKILTRQAKYLREALKGMRSQAGKAKKGWTAASILVKDTYPQWKIDTLLWMKEQYNGTSFACTFMNDLKDWTSTTVADKKMLKNHMQFASFVMKEVEEVGVAALDVQLPFDQKEILSECKAYIAKQLEVATDLEIINLDNDTLAAAHVPENRADIATPGAPYLWLR
jgi:leucyl-tRNA synthetase